ncbi:uncharacterized protein LOC118460332 [Anopheles albimanus]|uniref:uncharacterized protein LOC118460332 n=1 Tax=Anopheles albimanus TaxID=7167 RepID=UPI00163E2506|nr:uncharacterized protein LOC118460332 [Anopheles albimanus]
MDGGSSITKHSLTGTSVTSTNDISITSYERTCDIFRLSSAHGTHQQQLNHRDGHHPTTVQLLDQLAAQLSDEELSSIGAAVELMLDGEDVEDGEGILNGTAGHQSSALSQAPMIVNDRTKCVGEEESLVTAGLSSPLSEYQDEQRQESAEQTMYNGNDEEDEDELTEKQLSY